MITIAAGHYVRDGFELKLDIAIPRGRFVAVLGPSGSGKSTLLNIISGFDALASGDIMLNGQSATTQPPAVRPVSLVFQDNNNFAHLDCWSNVALGVSPSLKLSVAQRYEVDVALQAVGLSHLSQRRPGDMSGGERQRIAIARVLVRKKPILLLDEAFAALGPGLRREMLDVVKALHVAHGLTTLMVTHQPEDAKRVADSVIYVDGHVVRKPMPVAAFFASSDEQISRYLGEWQ